MPLYEYRCNQCGEAFEKMVRFSEADHVPACPNCESKDTRKAISTIASFGTADSGFSGSSRTAIADQAGDLPEPGRALPAVRRQEQEDKQ